MRRLRQYIRDFFSHIALQIIICDFSYVKHPIKKHPASDIDPEKLNLEAFRAEYFRMKKENETLADKEKTCRSESGELRKYLTDLDRFIGTKKMDRGLE